LYYLLKKFFFCLFRSAVTNHLTTFSWFAEYVGHENQNTLNWDSPICNSYSIGRLIWILVAAIFLARLKLTNLRAGSIRIPCIRVNQRKSIGLIWCSSFCVWRSSASLINPSCCISFIASKLAEYHCNVMSSSRITGILTGSLTIFCCAHVTQINSLVRRLVVLLW